MSINNHCQIIIEKRIKLGSGQNICDDKPLANILKLCESHLKSFFSATDKGFSFVWFFFLTCRALYVPTCVSKRGIRQQALSVHMSWRIHRKFLWGSRHGRRFVQDRKVNLTTSVPQIHSKSYEFCYNNNLTTSVPQIHSKSNEFCYNTWLALYDYMVRKEKLKLILCRGLVQ